MRRRLVALALAAAATVVIAQPSSSSRGRDGGILQVVVSPSVYDNYIDPALSFTPAGWSFLDATCARLYTYPDARLRLQPEVAEGFKRSSDMKTYTFTLRRGFRFSNGEPVRASAFAQAINRVLDPVVRSPGAIFMRDIVGADDVLAGRRQTPAGVVARGNTLVVKFTRPAPNFVARTAYPFFCAVPPGLPPSAEGLGRFPSAGPYYVTDYRSTEEMKIRRNRFYGGERKIHLDGFNVDFRGGNPVELLRTIDRGEADWGPIPGGVFAAAGLDFEAKYGRNKSRYWVRPGMTLRLLVFNSSRPLFHNNPRLRQAVNLALDRRALLAYGPGLSRATDQILPPSVPGFRNANIYPLGGNLERAQELARGQLRSGEAVFYVTDFPPLVATALLVKEQLARIGLEVEIRLHPAASTAGYFTQLTGPGAEWDMVFLLWFPNIPDPYEYLSLLLETQRGGEALTRVRSKLASAARLTQERARNRAYAEVDAMIARDVAPVAVLSVLNEATLLSERVGCPVLRPALDLAVACLRG